MVQKISGVYRLLNNPHLGEAVVVSNPYSGEVTEIVVHGHS
jgi:phage baseplate assembly protein gpV